MQLEKDVQFEKRLRRQLFWTRVNNEYIPFGFGCLGMGMCWLFKFGWIFPKPEEISVWFILLEFLVCIGVVFFLSVVMGSEDLYELYKLTDHNSDAVEKVVYNDHELGRILLHYGALPRNIRFDPR